MQGLLCFVKRASTIQMGTGNLELMDKCCPQEVGKCIKDNKYRKR